MTIARKAETCPAETARNGAWLRRLDQARTGPLWVNIELLALALEITVADLFGPMET